MKTKMKVVKLMVDVIFDHRSEGLVGRRTGSGNGTEKSPMQRSYEDRMTIPYERYLVVTEKRRKETGPSVLSSAQRSLPSGSPPAQAASTGLHGN